MKKYEDYKLSSNVELSKFDYIDVNIAKRTLREDGLYSKEVITILASPNMCDTTEEVIDRVEQFAKTVDFEKLNKENKYDYDSWVENSKGLHVPFKLENDKEIPSVMNLETDDRLITRYYPNGLLAMIIDLRPTQAINHIYSYDDMGRCVRYTHVSQCMNGKYMRTIEYVTSYDDQNHTSLTKVFTNSTLVYTTETQWNLDFSKKDFEINKGLDGEIDWILKYTYDEMGNEYILTRYITREEHMYSKLQY